MRQSLMTRLLLALILTLTLTLSAATQAAPTAQELDPSQAANLLPARVAFVHAAPFEVSPAGPSTVTLTATQAGQTAIIRAGLTISTTIPYVNMPSGNYTFGIYTGTLTLAGLAAATPVYTEALSLQGGTDYTVVAVGQATASYPLDLIAFTDTLPAQGANEALVRIIHAAPIPPDPTAALVDVVNEAGPPLLADDLAYATATSFTALTAGLYDVRIDSAITPTTVLDPPALPLPAGTIVSLVAVIDSNTGLPGIVPLAFTPRAVAEVRIVHAAPFTTGAATATPVLDPTFGSAANQVFGALDFGEASLYKTVTPGIYDAKVLVGASITGTVALTQSLTIQDGQRLTVVVVGTNTLTYPLALEALIDSVVPTGSATADVRIFHAAPFGATPDDTGVDVVAEDGSPLSPPLIDLRYRQATDYLTLPSGTPIDLKVVATGVPTTTLINPPALTFSAGSIQTVIAIGGANGQLPSAIVLNDLQTTRRILLPIIGR